MNHLFVWLQHLLPKRWLSGRMRALAQSRVRWWKNLLIAAFVRLYSVDMAEAEHSGAGDYESFGQFFVRALRPGARPLSGRAEDLSWPADGALVQSGVIARGQVLQAKGREYALADLLQSEALAQGYEGGWHATIYLAPHNYHRVHAPLGGRLTGATHIPGSLFSVNAATARHLPGLFARNERTLCRFAAERPEVGDFHVILVGALLVSGIEITAEAGQLCARGNEIGRFNYGSTVILLFRPGALAEPPDIAAGTAVEMGQTFARIGVGADAERGDSSSDD